MEKQVLSIDQCKELVALGLDMSDASMCYIEDSILPYDESTHKIEDMMGYESIPTFTLQDILEILPKPCYINCIDEDFYQCEVTTNNGSLGTNGKTAIRAAFNMLKCCKQNNSI